MDEAAQHRPKNAIVVFVQRTVYEDASIEVVVLWQVALSVQRKGGIPVGVAPADAAVSPEDENIAPLISGDSAGSLERFLLGVEVARNPFGARLADCPLLPARNNILALGCHSLHTWILVGKLYHGNRQPRRRRDRPLAVPPYRVPSAGVNV